jgi:Phage portal protein, SPP1 Gp6-like
VGVMAGVSPVWWLDRLYGELVKRAPKIALMDSYYTGEHPLPFLTRAHKAKMRDEFRLLLEDSRSNFMRLIVDVCEERMRVDGFRLSASSSEPDDRESWNIWQANQMDAHSQTAFVEALVKGVSYMSVWEGERDGDPPVIAVEDPSQTIVGYVPGSNFRRRAAALKVWSDDWTGRQRANVYLPDGIHKFERSGNVALSSLGDASRSMARDQSGWIELEDEFVANPWGVVPIVPLRNRPRLLVEGESELSDVYRVQNQINGFLFLLALAGYFGAHKQRWAVGLTLHVDPNTNKPLEPFDVAIDRLIHSGNPDARFGEFSQTDLGGYINAIEQKILHIAVTTRTPRHYLHESGQSPSGDAIKSAESGLVKKVGRKQRTFGEGLEETLRLARLISGKSDTPVDSEVVWADPAVRSEAEVTDAAIKRFQVGLTPWAQTMEDLGYSSTQIASMLQSFGGVPPTADTDGEAPVAA